MKMKTFAFACSLLLSSIALAYPAVNDSVTFNATEVKDTETNQAVLQIHLAAYDSAKDAYQQVSSTTTKGKTTSNEEWVAASELFNKETYTQVSGNCDQFGGKIESVTVAAGTFETCAIPNEDKNESGVYWIGDVPFGIVKAELTDKATSAKTTYELQAFENGK
jgi:hypothetical protein